MFEAVELLKELRVELKLSIALGRLIVCAHVMASVSIVIAWLLAGCEGLVLAVKCFGLLLLLMIVIFD